MLNILKALHIYYPQLLACSFQVLSPLLGEYFSPAAVFSAHNFSFSASQVPITPGWGEASLVKCLAQGHKETDGDQTGNQTRHSCS